MNTETDNLVLEHMCAIGETMDRMSDDVRELKVRVTGVETGVATLNNHMDRMELRLERIEKRLDLVGS